jgi:phosphoserine phosphatase
MANVAFDVDGTLIDEEDEPRQDIIDILVAHHERGDSIYVWSGGGMDYARTWVSLLGLNHLVTQILPKQKRAAMDIAYDDMEVKLAKVNICVGSGQYEERW